jgi:hypothetical protein
MLTRTKVALAAALLLGVASAAQAAGRDDADHAGGFRVGPLGQSSTAGVNPADHRSLARGAYGSVRTAEPGYMAVQDQFYRNSFGD